MSTGSPTVTRSVQASLLSFLESYKTLFNTTYSTLQTHPAQSPQSIQQKQQLITNLHQTYRQVIDSIDCLEQVSFGQTKKLADDDESQKNSMMYIGNQSSGNILGRDELRHEQYEKEVCEEHDNAVKRYKDAIKNVQIWREHLYKYINQNMPSGGNH